MQAKEWHVLRAVIAAGIMSFSAVSYTHLRAHET